VIFDPTFTTSYHENIQYAMPVQIPADCELSDVILISKPFIILS